MGEQGLEESTELLCVVRCESMCQSRTVTGGIRIPGEVFNLPFTAARVHFHCSVLYLPSCNRWLPPPLRGSSRTHLEALFCIGKERFSSALYCNEWRCQRGGGGGYTGHILECSLFLTSSKVQNAVAVHADHG